MTYYYTSEFYHHGIKGQQWGERRFQNEDGSLTPAGRLRYLKQLENERDNTDNQLRKYVEKRVDKEVENRAIKRALVGDTDDAELEGWIRDNPSKMLDDDPEYMRAYKRTLKNLKKRRSRISEINGQQ